MKTFVKILFIFLLTVQLSSCKKEDETPSPQIQILGGEYELDELNACNIGSGDLASEFDFYFDLKALVPNADAEEVYFDLEWSDGDTDQDIKVNNWSLSDATLSFDWCFRFGSTEWFEITVRIVDVNDVVSNEVTIKVDKPTDAN